MKDKIEELKKEYLEELDRTFDIWYEGGMDVSYSGHRYDEGVENLWSFFTTLIEQEKNKSYLEGLKEASELSDSAHTRTP